jgi:hypothetical protein
MQTRMLRHRYKRETDKEKKNHVIRIAERSTTVAGS